MKLSFVAVLIFTGFLLAACGAGTPDIELAESQSDLGVVTNGEIPTIEIAVRNLGKGDLVIEAVTTSCGCTTASITPEVIPAGGTGTLAIRYDSGAHGPNEVGPVMRQIFIASNDPDKPEIEFRLLAEVVAAQP